MTISSSGHAAAQESEWSRDFAPLASTEFVLAGQLNSQFRLRASEPTYYSISMRYQSST
jgi:hypothetical protein